MIKSGTTAFSDMYFHIPDAARAAAHAGIRCTLGINVFGDGDDLSEQLIEHTLLSLEPYSNLVQLAIAPHSVYTVSPKGLLRTAQLANRYGLLYHIHMSETEEEVHNCLNQHGCRPFQLLHRLGVLELTQGHFAAAHCLYLNPDEYKLLGSVHGTAIHNPCSNLKLGSGHFFPYSELKASGVNVALGTDGFRQMLEDSIGGAKDPVRRAVLRRLCAFERKAAPLEWPRRKAKIRQMPRISPSKRRQAL